MSGRVKSTGIDRLVVLCMVMYDLVQASHPEKIKKIKKVDSTNSYMLQITSWEYTLMYIFNFLLYLSQFFIH